MRVVQYVVLLGLICAGCAQSIPVGCDQSLWAAPRVVRTGQEDATSLGSSRVGLRRLAHEVLGTPIEPGAEQIRLCDACERMTGADCADEVLLEQRVLRDYVWGRRSRTQVIDPAGHVPELANRPERLVPAVLARNGLVGKYVAGILGGGARRGGSQRGVSIAPQELAQFGRDALAVSTDYGESQKTTVGRMMRLYLAAWVRGEFVDRSGRKLPKPSYLGETIEVDGHPVSIKAPTILIENETILGFATVALEALLDASAPIPALFRFEGGDRVYLNSEGQEPTFAKLFKLALEVAESPAQISICNLCPDHGLFRRYVGGISPEEAQLIVFASELAGARSKAVSGMVVGMFKETKLQFVVGAHFAFGDSDTLRLLVERVFDIGSRRITEILAFETLREFDFLICIAGKQIRQLDGREFKGTALAIALLLQEQAILEKLLGEDK